MARPHGPADWLTTSRSCSEQIAALELLKNEITGHIEKKEKYAEQGVLDQVVRLLQTSRSGQNHNDKGRRESVSQPRNLSEQDHVRLQALQVLSVLANGGPPFLQPIHAAGAMPAILANIYPLDNHPKIVLWALRALYSIAESTSLASHAAPGLEELATVLFTPLCLGAFHSVLASESRHRLAVEQKHLVASLISLLCQSEEHRSALANYGILDDLATMLAAFVVSRGEVVPAAEQMGQSDGLDAMIPSPAPPGSNLTVVLAAISAIIAESRFRTYLLVCSPAIMAVFPNADFKPATRAKQGVRVTLAFNDLMRVMVPPHGAVDSFLPTVPVVQPKPPPQPVLYPPLGFIPTRDMPPTTSNPRSPYKFSFWDTASTTANDESEPDEESPFVPWLIHLVRSADHGIDRVMAASVLASLFKAGFAGADKESMIAVLVVPILCRLLKHHSPLSDLVGEAEPRLILERAPSVLARLVAGSELLQKAAHDCKALETGAHLLVESYNLPAQQTPPRPWSPTRQDPAGAYSVGSRLGEPGHLPEVAHKLKVRESSLRLIAAMLPFKEDYRQALVDQDMVGYVVESLQPYPSKPKPGKERVKAEKGAEDVPPPPSGPSPYGNNPDSVLVAACHVIRLLGRSVSILRTSLGDHGTAVPLFRLLKHPDTDVQVAACGAVCNLVMEFSPLRDLIDAGVVKVLCEHAHSQNAELRHNAVWSLKHLVNDAPNSLRKQCLDDLGPGWLVQLITDDTEDDALFARLKMNQHRDRDTDMDLTDVSPGGSEPERSWLWPALYRTNSTRSTSQRIHSPRVERAEARLAGLREAEINPVRKARNDDLAIQEQALGFIRNLLGPPAPRAASTDLENVTEMVDYLFNELGQDRLFEILTSKLRTRVLHPFERRYSAATTGRGGVGGGADALSRVLYPQARTVENVIYILVHMAASVPRHRQLVISQTELLRQVGTHFSSAHAFVRAALCQLFINLLWKENQDDVESCAGRARELRRLGVLSKLEALQTSDPELDVRERARVAVWEMKKLPHQ